MLGRGFRARRLHRREDKHERQNYWDLATIRTMTCPFVVRVLSGAEFAAVGAGARTTGGIQHPARKHAREADCLTFVKHSTQMVGCINIGRAQMRGTTTMRKIIGPVLIVLTLAGCAVGGDLPGDSAWSRDYFKVTDKKQSPG